MRARADNGKHALHTSTSACALALSTLSLTSTLYIYTSAVYPFRVPSTLRLFTGTSTMHTYMFLILDHYLQSPTSSSAHTGNYTLDLSLGVTHIHCCRPRVHEIPTLPQFAKTCARWSHPGGELGAWRRAARGTPPPAVAGWASLEARSCCCI